MTGQGLKANANRGCHFTKMQKLENSRWKSVGG